MTYPSRFRGKCAWSTPFLKIRKGLVGAFGLHDDHPIPSRINEEIVRIRYWDTWNQYLGPASLMTIPSRSSSRRSDHEIRTMDPSNDVMIRSLRTVLLNIIRNQQQPWEQPGIRWLGQLTFPFALDLAATANSWRSLHPRD